MSSVSPESGSRLERHRFFFALKPDAETARRTHAFALERFGAKGLLRPEHHHITLALTEDVEPVPEPLIAALRGAGDAVEGMAFDLQLDRLVGSAHFISLRPSVPPPALFALQSSIADALARHEVPMRQGWTFMPHQTLGYRKDDPFEQRIEGFSWRVADFVLVDSHVGLGRHDVIGRWPLRKSATS